MAPGPRGKGRENIGLEGERQIIEVAGNMGFGLVYLHMKDMLTGHCYL